MNTHHHLFQSLTRAVPGGQDALLFGWLKVLYPIWARFGPEEMFVSAQVGLAELALSGCSMSSDHLYLFPNGAGLDDTIAAAGEVGLRFHPTRGAMSIGETAGGLPPDTLVEREADIVADCIRVVDRFHNAAEGAMLRVGIAPCSPFTVSRDLSRQKRRTENLDLLIDADTQLDVREWHELRIIWSESGRDLRANNRRGCATSTPPS